MGIVSSFQTLCVLLTLPMGEPAPWTTSHLVLSSDSAADSPRTFLLHLQHPDYRQEYAAIDLAIVVDLSASQQGPAFRETIEGVKQFVKGLQGGSRVQIFLAHASGKAIPNSPAAVGSRELEQALQNLIDSSPRGLADMRFLVDAIHTWQENRSGTLAKRVVLAGDFSTAIGWPEGVRQDEWVESLLRQGITVSAMNRPENLAEPARLLVDRAEGIIELPADGLQNISNVGPVYTELAFVPDDKVSEIFPPKLSEQKLQRGVWLMGRAIGPTINLTVRGRRDGEAFKEVIPVSLDGAEINPQIEQFRQFIESTPSLRLQQELASVNLQQLERRIHLQEARTRPKTEIAQATAPAEESPSIETAKTRDSLRQQQLVSQINQTTDQAKKLLRKDPASAMELLKRTLQFVDVAVADAATKAKLRGKVETLLRSARAERTRSVADDLARQQALAGSDARRREAVGQISREDRRRMILDRYRALLAEGNSQEASNLAEQAAANDPSDLATLAADLQGTLADRYARVEQIELDKQRGFWNTLSTVEQSSIPIPDDREIVFPNAKAWELLSARREKYKRPDVRAISPSEEKIRESLRKPITIDFKETPLRQVIDILKEFVGTNIVLDLQGLDEAGVDPEEPITLSLTDIPLRSALALMLEPLELAHVVRNDVLQITSQLSAESQLETRVYPVADLVIPIANFNGGGVGLNGQVNGGQGQTGNQGANRPAGDGLQNFQAPGGNPGGALRRDMSDELKKLIRSVIDRQADANKPGDWDRHFAGVRESDESIRAAVVRLAENKQHHEVVQMLVAARRWQPVGRWSQQAELLSRALADIQDVPLEEVALSIASMDPNSKNLWREATRLLALSGQSAQAAKLLRMEQETSRPSVLVLLNGLKFAIDAEEIDQVVWMATPILNRPWVSGDIDPASLAREQLNRFKEALRQQGKKVDADRIESLLDASPERDMVVTLQWEGEADLDLAIIEPTEFYCSLLTPETLGGGVLRGDLANSKEEYVLTQGFTGNYEIRITKVWGEPTAGIANLDIVRHQGTKNEKRERRTVSLAGQAEKGTTITLADGRRRELARTADSQTLTVDSGASRPKAELRRFLQTTTPGGPAPGGLVPFAIAQGGFAGGRAIAFDPVVTAIPDGVNLQAQAVVSADRRFVRMTLVPLVQSIQSVNDVRVFQAVGPAPSN
jgi:tetratricopeptide (TPR) repeat protein